MLVLLLLKQISLSQVILFLHNPKKVKQELKETSKYRNKIVQNNINK
jgi:hypothetical protein